MPIIAFGTDGWRAVIAQDYTFANLEIVSRATARWLRNTYGPSSRVAIGYDTRFLSPEFAGYTARILASYGVRVFLADGVTPTPAVSWATRTFGCNAGVVITASHNPPQYNGFKLKADFGGPASPEMIAAVEGELYAKDDARPILPMDELIRGEGIELRDIRGEYLSWLRTRLDLDAIRHSGIRVAHDAMFGAGKGAVAELLGADRVVAVRNDWNPGFHGQAPEPIERNLAELSSVVVREGCAAGLANDGDADRIGMVDETGRFVDSHQMLSLLLKYLHCDRGLTGSVIKTFSTTDMLDKMAGRYGLLLETTPIGFKYIGSRMVGSDVLIGGEESGGIAVKGHLPERDGLYIGLLFVEMIVKSGKPLSALVRALHDEFGPHFYFRKDVHTTPEKKNEALALLKGNGITSVAGRSVLSVETLDGYKLKTEAGWVLVRPSGTEPVLRIYSESASAEQAEALVNDAIARLGIE